MNPKVDQLVESLLENKEFDPVSYRITGNYPLRELAPEELEAENPKWIVHFPRGHETLQIAVYGDGLNEGDAVESANEFLSKTSGASERDGEEAFAIPFTQGSKW